MKFVDDDDDEGNHTDLPATHTRTIPAFTPQPQGNGNSGFPFLQWESRGIGNKYGVIR